MGFCAMFPWLCGIGKKGITRVLQMMELVKDIADAMDAKLEGVMSIPERLAIIEVARAEATQRLIAAGLNPYTD